MSDSKKQNPYEAPVHSGEAIPVKSGSIFWMVLGGALGAIIGAFIIGRPDELFRDHSVFVMVPMLCIWGFIGLLGSAVWRLPRYWFWGPIQTPAIARFASGVLLFVTCIMVLQMGRTGVIDLPEPAMGITMISMLLTCVIGCVEFEAWCGRRMR
ncbi:MAG: hypothetical protein AAGG48_31080 [Planctomycetota bacterium]